MNQREQFEEWAMDEEDGLCYTKEAMSKINSDGTYFYTELNDIKDSWMAGQKALIPYMEVLLADIQTIIAFGLFTPSPKLQEAIDFIKSATEEQS